MSKYPEIRSKIIFSHVRAASTGGSPSHLDTHPFSREVNGRDFAGAHNGTIDKRKLEAILAGSSFKPVGGTDSERAFCYIFGKIKEANVQSWSRRDFAWLVNILQEVNVPGTFNAIFSDGEHLFCYADKGLYNCLSFTRRKAPFQEIVLLDKKRRYQQLGTNETEAERLSFVNLPAHKDTDLEGYIVSTTVRTGPPTDEPWIQFKGGELIVFKDGKMVFSSARDTALYQLDNVAETVLTSVRQADHAVQASAIAAVTGVPEASVRQGIESLQHLGVIKEHTDNAGHFYTTEVKRWEIDDLLKLVRT